MRYGSTLDQSCEGMVPGLGGWISVISKDSNSWKNRFKSLLFPFQAWYAFASLNPKSPNYLGVIKAGIIKLVFLISSARGLTGVICVHFRAYNGLKENNAHTTEPRGQVAEPRLSQDGP